MTADREVTNRLMLRARDAMDRDYRERARHRRARRRRVCVRRRISSARSRSTFGETPHRYLQRRRVERAMYLLRTTDHDITDICMDVGFSSLGTFSRTFTEIVGETPTRYRTRGCSTTCRAAS